MRSDYKPLIELQIRDVSAVIHYHPKDVVINQRCSVQELRKLLPISTDLVFSEDGPIVKLLILEGGKLFKLFITSTFTTTNSTMCPSDTCTTCFIEDAYLSKTVHSFSMLNALNEGLGCLYQRVRKELQRRRIDVEGFYL